MMDLATTNISVDRCTPRDKHLRRHISFPKSVRTSVDDLVLDSPLNAYYAIGNEFRPRSRTRSYAAKVVEGVWMSGSPVSPSYPRSPSPHDKEPEQACARKDSLSSSEQPPLSTPATTALFALDRTLRDTGFDTSCLDELDEQLLRSPTDCFLEICWAAAVQEEQQVQRPRGIAELDVDFVDMGVNVDPISNGKPNAVGKCPKKGGWGVWVPPSPPPVPPPAVRPTPITKALTTSPRSLSSAESDKLVSPKSVPRRKWAEDGATSPVLHEKKVVPFPITPSTYQAHHIDLVLASSAPSSPLQLPPPHKARASDRDEILAASVARILYSNPNDSVHYFPVPRDREKKEKKGRASSSSRESNRAKSQPRPRTESHNQAESAKHLSPSHPSARSQTGSRGRKSKKKRPVISGPTLVQASQNTVMGVDINAHTNMMHAHAIAIPTFPSSGYHTFPPSTPALPPDNVDPPSTPKSPNGKLRIISSAYSTLTGRRRAKSSV
ncbi:hypothetical protein ID866_8882 [Astraeus odoratus]|nr:hypothetical protein ID866_8882 [Astraeus odoratus]